MKFRFSGDSANFPGSCVSQDRTWFDISQEGIRAALADGAGGVFGGARAAEMFISYFQSVHLAKETLCREFAKLDLGIMRDSLAGDTTGIFLFTIEGDLVGASVGDSEAWFLPDDGEFEDLTEHQYRKPLLGRGEAMAVSFKRRLEAGLLLLASDGLTKYAEFSEVLARLRAGAIETLAGDLADLARLPSGGLQDDLALVVIRIEADTKPGVESYGQQE